MHQLVRLSKVSELTGKGRSSIYESISAGEFPKPVKINKRAVAWVLSEVEEWIEERIRSRESEAA